MSTPYVVPKVTLNENSNHEYEHLRSSCNSEEMFNNCSTRHNIDSHTLNCRFAYTTWCPVCESQEGIKQAQYGGRRRCKSEGMDVDRSEDYYCKVSQQHKQSDKFCKQSPNKTYNRPNYVRVSESYNMHPEIRNENMSNNSRPWLNFCENKMPDWNLCQRTKELSKDISPLHERYYSEVENLRIRLHEHQESPSDGKRLRQNSESDSNTVYDVKRPRDNSPVVNGTVPRKILPSIPQNFKPSVPKAALVPRQLNIPSSDSATSISSDSDCNDSACDEEEFKDEPDGESEEILVPHLSEVGSSVSPSHAVSHSLHSISLSDNLTVSDLIPHSNLHPGLRASLFSHIPPYIKFCTHDATGCVLPAPVQRLLKWKLSTITPVVVRKTIINSNFKLVRKSNDWCGTWGKHMKSICFKTLRDYQKINHFPGTFQIGRKDRLWKNLFRLMTKFGKKEFGFIPRTYVLPQDSKLLRSAWEKNCGKEKWIVKPPASARGTGIRVIHKWTQIPKKCPLVVQKYIADPYLINGSKFDLRLYVLVTSINPLCIYLYDNGLVRFASVKYSNEMSTLADRYMHLTNYSINKLSSQYTQNEDASACQGHKWTLGSLWSYLERENKVDVKALWANLVDLVVKTVISGESSISQLSHANLASRYCSYELFGVDVLLDQDLKPWLLEVNISPSLHSSSPLDLAVKGPLVKDLMNIAGYQIPNKLNTQLQEDIGRNLGVETGLCYDRRLYTTALSQTERQKQMSFQQMETRDDYLEEILQELTPDDVRHLVKYEDELTQIGNFQKIFPTTETHEYHQFFEAPRYYNMLFDAWETKQQQDRTSGICLLESLCRKKVHLDTTQIPPKCAKACANPSESTLNNQDPNTKHQDQGQEEEEEEEEVENHIAVVPEMFREKWTVTLCRAARPRSGKPCVITKPFPRSSYIARKTVLRTAKSSRVAS